MTMSKLFRNTLLTLFIASTFVSFGQSTNTVKNLLDSALITQSNRTVILMETDTFLLLTTYKLFKDNCKLFIKEYDLDWDRDLLKLFIGNKSKIIYADSITKTAMNKSRLIFRMADLLESGNCLVYNKKKKRLEKTVATEIYSTKFITGRAFMTKENFLIFKTEDGVF